MILRKENYDQIFFSIPVPSQLIQIDQKTAKMAKNNQQRCQGVRWHENYFSDLVSK